MVLEFGFGDQTIFGQTLIIFRSTYILNDHELVHISLSFWDTMGVEKKTNELIQI